MRVSANRYAPRALIAVIAAFGIYDLTTMECHAFQKLNLDDGCQSWVTDDYNDIRLPNGNRIIVQVPCGNGLGLTGGGHHTTRQSGNTIIETQTKAGLVKTFQWDGGDRWILIKVEPLKSH